VTDNQTVQEQPPDLRAYLESFDPEPVEDAEGESRVMVFDPLKGEYVLIPSSLWKRRVHTCASLA